MNESIPTRHLQNHIPLNAKRTYIISMSPLIWSSLLWRGLYPSCSAYPWSLLGHCVLKFPIKKLPKGLVFDTWHFCIRFTRRSRRDVGTRIEHNLTQFNILHIRHILVTNYNISVYWWTSNSCQLTWKYIFLKNAKLRFLPQDKLSGSQIHHQRAKGILIGKVYAVYPVFWRIVYFFFCSRTTTLRLDAVGHYSVCGIHTLTHWLVCEADGWLHLQPNFKIHRNLYRLNHID